MDKDTQNIESLLSQVRAIEGDEGSASEGLIIRRVVEHAENNWNATHDNSATNVEKTFTPADLQAAAEEIGLGKNDAVLAFIEASFELTADDAKRETMTISKDDVGELDTFKL